MKVSIDELADAVMETMENVKKVSVDELIEKFCPIGQDVCITPLTDWEREWYTRRGYKVIDE